MDNCVVMLGTEGIIKLPESVRRDLAPGTCFLVRREKDSIVLQAVRDALSTRFDLSPEAFEFTNELIAEERQEYLIQVALTNESHE